MTLALPARAKLNLDLEVVGLRADGFHDIRTTIQSVDLHDLLEISPAAETFLTVDGLRVISDAGNTVLKAHAALERATQRTLPANFHLHKRVPPGSGLGGASSDAAAALLGLKSIHRLDVDLKPIAGEVGADVPYFLHGGRALVEGRGEAVRPLTMQPAWFVIAWPEIELPTADVYRAWDDVKGESPNHLRRAAEHIDGRIADFANRIGPDWQMTGSGSAFFKACATRRDAEREAAAIDCWTAVTQAVGPWS